MPGRSTLIPSSSTSSEDLASNIKERAPPGATLGDVEHQRIPPEKEKEILEDDSFRVVWADKDPENPFNWSWAKKASISFVSIWMTLYVAASAVSYSVAVRGIQQDLEVSRVVALLGITFFTLGFAIAPMVLAPISEVYGRSVLYYTTYGLYTLMFIPQAMAPNITCMLIARFMGGVFGSTGSTMVGGTLADTYVVLGIAALGLCTDITQKIAALLWHIFHLSPSSEHHCQSSLPRSLTSTRA